MQRDTLVCSHIWSSNIGREKENEYSHICSWSNYVSQVLLGSSSYASQLDEPQWLPDGGNHYDTLLYPCQTMCGYTWIKLLSHPDSRGIFFAFKCIGIHCLKCVAINTLENLQLNLSTWPPLEFCMSSGTIAFQHSCSSTECVLNIFSFQTWNNGATAQCHCTP